MNIFRLAEKQVEREGFLNKFPRHRELLLILDRAIKIRKWLDNSERNTKVNINRYKQEG